MITADTLTMLDFNKVRAEISNLARSDVSCHTLRALCPESSLEAITLTSGRIAEIRALAVLGISLNIVLFSDIRPLLDQARPSGAILPPADLLLLIPVLEQFRDLAKQLTPRADIPLLKSIAPQLRSFPDILEPLTASIAPDATIADSATPALADIRRAKRGLAARIRKKIEEIIRANGIEPFLQDDFITQRSGRWVIPVRMDSKGMVKGVVHDVSSSGETAFMEPIEIIPFVNELENLTADEKAEEIRILRRLTAWIREDASDLAACFGTLVQLDVLDAIARYADTYDMTFPAINSSGELFLKGARHPLLLLQEKNGALDAVVPLTLRLGESGRVMVITGPNAGGKTIALKTAGILVTMALCGFPIPAEPGSTIPLVATLLADIGDDQSIERSLSTYSAHISRISSILTQADNTSLILLDEIGAGTEPHQGAAIACAVIADLYDRGALVIATTHLSDIIGFAHRTPGIVNAGMEYDVRTYSPRYRLVPGEPGQSHALDIALRFGLPDRIVTRARELLGSSGEEFTALLADLRQRRVELDQERQGLDARFRELSAREKMLDARASDVEELRRKAAEQARSDVRELISSTRRRMNQLLDELKRENRNEIIEKIRNTEKALEKHLSEGSENASPALRPPVHPAIGDTVHIASLGCSARILSLDERHHRARVRAGSIEADVAMNDICAPLSGESRGREVVKPRIKLDIITEEEDELKLLGLRVDEALERMERFLNHASAAGAREVRIIHGIGTGRLRDAVREELSRHPLVEESRPGERHEGRDGATVVTLRQ